MFEQTKSEQAPEGSMDKLVFTKSRDGLPLEGAVIAPEGSQGADLAVVWIHGGASKFYERHYVTIGRELAIRGYPFLTGNTRGHDAFTLLWRGDEVIPAGGSFERFDEAPRDIAAWVDFAMTLGVRGVVLAGHSLGASKVVYYQAQQEDPRVQGLVAASPAVGWQSHPERVALAERMVDEGHGEDLLPHLEGSPRWNIVSAQMVLTREQIIRHAFDSDSRAPFIGDVKCPLLVLYGADEDVDEEWLETLRRNARSTTRVDIQMVDGAQHEYAGREHRVAQIMDAWMEILA
jgi:alpha-beta hydrolase superfamily lysophospholipase